MVRTDSTAFITVVELFALQEGIVRAHILSKPILCLTLHAELPPQLAIFGKFQTKLFSPYYFLVTFSFNSCVALSSEWRFGNLTSCVYYYPTKIKTNEAKVEGLVTALSSREGHAWASWTAFEKTQASLCVSHNSQRWPGCMCARCNPAAVRGRIATGFHPQY